MEVSVNDARYKILHMANANYCNLMVHIQFTYKSAYLPRSPVRSKITSMSSAGLLGAGIGSEGWRRGITMPKFRR